MSKMMSDADLAALWAAEEALQPTAAQKLTEIGEGTFYRTLSIYEDMQHAWETKLVAAAPRLRAHIAAQAARIAELEQTNAITSDILASLLAYPGHADWRWHVAELVAYLNATKEPTA